MATQATGTVQGKAVDRWAELVRVMGSERDAAAAMDWEIARKAAQARLAKKGIRRAPSGAEVERILQAM